MEVVHFENIGKQSQAMKESLRVLKTNIQFSGDDVKVILLTSCIPNEGKSTVAVNLALSMTESNKSVLLVDSDIRKSVLVGRLGARSVSGKEVFGLSHYLSGQRKIGEVLYATETTGMFVVFAGPPVPNPTEILEKKYYAELLEFGRENFDYVIVDCAPIGAAIDAAVVAKHCDGALIIVGQGMVSTRMLASAKKQLEPSGIQLLGVVLNKMQFKKAHYGQYYGGYYSEYYSNYGSEE